MTWSAAVQGVVGSWAYVGIGDPRGLALFAVALGVTYLVLVRPGGLGDRFRASREAEEARRIARGDPVVRPGCVGAMALVLVVVVVGAVVGVLVMG